MRKHNIAPNLTFNERMDLYTNSLIYKITEAFRVDNKNMYIEHYTQTTPIDKNDFIDIMYSYNTPVIIKHSFTTSDNKIMVVYSISGLYTSTTRRHISHYAKNFTRGLLTYQDFKNAFKTNKEIIIVY